MNNLSKFAVSAPIGAFGNHIRWLILLDNKFQFNNLFPERTLYNTFKGANWPEYENFTAQILQSLPINLQEEIKTKLFTESFSFNTTNKIDFIINSVYPSTRSFHNWLKYEWQFRPMLDYLIPFDHILPNQDFEKVLIITIDSTLAYQSYFKFNSLMHFGNKEILTERNNYSVNQNLELVKNRNIDYKILNAEILFDEVLDYNFYKSVIDFFKLDNNYNSAKIIHSEWYKGQKRSESEFVKHALDLYQIINKE
jgi:hypothetical protein